MKYFIYCRRSSEREDKQTLSIKSQERILTEYAERMKLEIVDSFSEDKTAYKPNVRPKFAEMLQRIRDGEADAILTYHLSRLARNALDGGQIIHLIDEKIIREIRTPQNSYHKQDTFIMAIEFAVTKKSSDDTSLYVLRDIESKLLKGEYPSAVPIGYLNITKDKQMSPNQYNSHKWKILEGYGRKLNRAEIDPIDGPLIAKIFEEAAKGTMSMRKLSDFATGLGIRSRKGDRLTKSTIHSMLKNPFYCGHIKYRGRLYTEDIQHEPLIEVSLFNRVQQVIGDRGKSRQKTRNFAYSGLIKCGECGCAITADFQRRYIYYHCTKNRECTQSKYLREEALEEQIQEVLEALVMPKDFLRVAFLKAREAHSKESKMQAVRMTELKRRHTLCKNKIDSLMDLRLSPTNIEGAELSDVEYATYKARFQTEKAELEEQIRDCENRSTNWLSDCERFIEWSQNLHIKLPQASIDLKKELMHLICSKMTLKDMKLTVVYDEPFASIVQLSIACSDSFERQKPFSKKKEGELFDEWRG